MIVYIYDENLNIIARPLVNSYEEFIANPSEIYKDWKPTFISDINEYLHAIIDNGTLRNKTREEQILLDNKTELLFEGEIIDNGAIIAVPKPEGFYKPLWQSPNWIESATLDEVKELKRVELKNHRDEEIYAPYIYTNSHIYDADLDSRNRLFQSQQLGVGTSSTIEWITADNKISTVSNTDLTNIVNGIAYREQLAFNKFASKYTEVLNCTNIDDVKNIKY